MTMEDHLAAVTVALRRAMEGLGAPVEMIAISISPGEPQPQISN